MKWKCKERDLIIEVTPVVCDYGIFINDKLELIMSQNGHANKVAELIMDDLILGSIDTISFIKED